MSNAAELTNPEQRSDAKADSDRETVEAIRQALRGLRYGQIVVIVQDGVVVQVDRTERKRLRVSGRNSAG